MTHRLEHPVVHVKWFRRTNREGLRYAMLQWTVPGESRRTSTVIGYVTSEEAEKARQLQQQAFDAVPVRASQGPSPLPPLLTLVTSRIYLIQGGIRYKIGFTARPIQTRIRNMQTGSPMPLTCLGHCLGTRMDEARLHALFAPWRCDGEWFEARPVIRSMFEAVCHDPTRQWPEIQKEAS